jgi:hypothetical protein
MIDPQTRDQIDNNPYCHSCVDVEHDPSGKTNNHQDPPGPDCPAVGTGLGYQDAGNDSCWSDGEGSRKEIDG